MIDVVSVQYNDDSLPDIILLTQGYYAPASAKTEGSSIVDDPGEG